MIQTVSDFIDVIVEPRYDTVTIPAAGTAGPLQFFTSPLGAAGGNFTAAASNKVLADTNMVANGTLPAGFNFVVLGFRLQPAFQMTVTDATNWSYGAWYTFTITDKPYLRVPADTIPAGAGPFAGGGITGTGAVPTVGMIAAASHGWPALANAFTIGRKPLPLAQTQNFNATLTWAVAQAVTTGTTIGATHQPAAGLPIRNFLDGYLKRIMQ